MIPNRASDERLRVDALAIWRAAVEAVRSDRLVIDNVHVDGQTLVIGDEAFDLSAIRRIVVVGAGKAGAGMAAGLERALGERVLAERHVAGWVNVPADCVRSLARIHLHAARAAGVNEPTAEGVAGTREILRLVGEAARDDLCIVLISGGGSALLPAPIDGITLADKQAVTRHLSAAGANIAELNCVRKQLSQVKGGGLLRACRAGRLVTLIISDVLGDPLDVIASGPTVEDRSTPSEALAVLERYAAAEARISPAVFDYLRRGAGARAAATCKATHIVIGNNAVAVDAAGTEAVRRGYSPVMIAATHLEGAAEEVGRDLARQAIDMQRDARGPDCMISGGEPVVRLVDAAKRGRGGRNQQLALAALEMLADENERDCIALLSCGTDGEDGPTDAAGALVDGQVIDRARRAALDPAEYLARNDAYSFFDAVDGLIRTGPTHTNVCDVRVVVVDRRVPSLPTVSSARSAHDS